MLNYGWSGYSINGLTYIIGVSLSEPHINGTALREIYVYLYVCMYVCMYICMVRPSRSVYTMCAYSNLVNCKFTLVQYYTAMSEC